MEEDLLARDTGFTFPQPTVVTCAIFRTSRNLSINTTGATGSSNQNLIPTTTETRSSPSSSRQFRLPGAPCWAPTPSLLLRTASTSPTPPRYHRPYSAGQEPTLRSAGKPARMNIARGAPARLGVPGTFNPPARARARARTRALQQQRRHHSGGSSIRLRRHRHLLSARVVTLTQIGLYALPRSSSCFRTSGGQSDP